MEALIGPVFLFIGVATFAYVFGSTFLGISLTGKKKEKTWEERQTEREMRKKTNPMRWAGRYREYRPDQTDDYPPLELLVTKKSETKPLQGRLLGHNHRKN